MGKPSAPPPVDYAGAAKEQGAANKEAAMTSWLLQNSGQVTPWGTQTLTKTGPGETDYTRTTTLNPQDQAMLDQTRQAKLQMLGYAPGMISNAFNTLATPFTDAGLPGMQYGVNAPASQRMSMAGLTPGVTNVQGGGIQGSVTDPNAIRKRVEDAAYGNFAARFDPIAEQRMSSERARLANMGGVTTSKGAMKDIANVQQGLDDQRRAAINDATLQGGNAAAQQLGMETSAGNFANQAQAQQFGQGMQNAGLQNAQQAQQAQLLGQLLGFNNAAGQQDFQNALSNANLSNAGRASMLQQMATMRQMPLNEMMSILSGSQVQAPQFGQMSNPNITAAPIFQGAQAMGQQGQQNYQNQVGQWNNMMSGAGGLAGAFMMSDRRAKRDITRVGFTPKGLPVYDYTDLSGDRQRGVMADELMLVRPDAVSVRPDGYLMVDYSKVE